MQGQHLLFAAGRKDGFNRPIDPHSAGMVEPLSGSVSGDRVSQAVKPGLVVPKTGGACRPRANPVGEAVRSSPGLPRGGEETPNPLSVPFPPRPCSPSARHQLSNHNIWPMIRSHPISSGFAVRFPLVTGLMHLRAVLG